MELVTEGDAGDCVYFVLAGLFGVAFRGPDGVVHEAARVGAGETVGEVAVRAGRGAARTATVTALEACEVLRLDIADYDELLRHRDRDDGANWVATYALF